MRLILDGVFNHASSDSLYFDRITGTATSRARASRSRSPWRTRLLVLELEHPARRLRSFFSLDTLPQLNHSLGRRARLPSLESVVRKNGTGPARAAGASTRPSRPGRRRAFCGRTSAGGRRRSRRRRHSSASKIWPDASALPAREPVRRRHGPPLRALAADGFVRQTAFTPRAATCRSSRSPPSWLDVALSRDPRGRSARRRVLASSSSSSSTSNDTVRALYLVRESGDSLAVARERQRLAALLQYTYVGVPTARRRRRGRDRRAGQERLRRSVQPRAVSVDGRERQRGHVRAAGGLHAVVVHAARRAAA